ncbi:MAG: RraA family protein [Oscillospiraceae bacterium]|nr:RraA family protein [Oscillospiraceae bacterium]
MYDVIKHYPRPSMELLERYEAVTESASLNEALPNRDGALYSKIKPVWHGARVLGSALTVQCGAGDNLMLHRALELIQPGDVLVVSCGLYDEAGAMMGGIMSQYVQGRKGCRGLVIDGACRDIQAMEQAKFPAFARNTSMKSVSKMLPGRINHPIVVGNVCVKPGDIVFGDADGVVVVPLELAEETLEKALAREKKEDELLASYLAGEQTIWEAYNFGEPYSRLGLSEEP